MLGFAAVMLFSCSGVPRDADEVVDRMIDAYGGPEKVELMESFIGKGFLKDQWSKSVIRYWSYDHYQRETMLKTKITLVQKEIVLDVRYTTYDGDNFRFVNVDGDFPYRQPSIDIRLIEYRFPLLLGWLQSTELEGKLTDNGDESGVCTIEYISPAYEIQIGVSRKDWLLSYVRLEDSADSTNVFEEAYTDYWKVDGVPFPSRFTGMSGEGTILYEYYFVKVEMGADLPDSIFAVSDEELALIPEKSSEPPMQ